MNVTDVDTVRKSVREFEHALDALPPEDMPEAYHIVGENPGEPQRLKENLRRIHDPVIKRFCIACLCRIAARRTQRVCSKRSSRASRILKTKIMASGTPSPPTIAYFRAVLGIPRFAPPFSGAPSVWVALKDWTFASASKRATSNASSTMTFTGIPPAMPFDDNTQDDAHHQRMLLTHEDFQTCYPDVNIHIHIDYEADRPFLVRMTRFTRGKVTSVEEFKRSFWMNGAYDAVVECTRSTELRTWRKAQTYSKETSWKKRVREVRVDPFPPPLTPHVSPFTSFDPLTALE